LSGVWFEACFEAWKVWNVCSLFELSRVQVCEKGYQRYRHCVPPGLWWDISPEKNEKGKDLLWMQPFSQM